MQQNYRFNIDGWLLIWKVQNALFCETSNMTFHEGSLKNNFGPWKVLEKRFQFSLWTLVSWKVFLILFGFPIQNIIHSSETLKVIFITRFLFYAIIDVLRQVSWKKVEVGGADSSTLRVLLQWTRNVHFFTFREK